MGGKPWSDDELQYLKDNYINSASMDEIVLKTGRTRDAIQRKASYLGLQLQHCNRNFFDEISLLSCYWAGFIAADGCIYIPRDRNGNIKAHTLSINQTLADSHHLELFAKAIDYRTPLRKSGSRKIKGTDSVTKPCAILRINSKQLTSKLQENFNITPRKSLTLQPPPDQNWSMSHKLAFIAGLIDGDGSILLIDSLRQKTLLRLNLVGTKPLLIWVLGVLTELIQDKLQSEPRTTSSKAYHITISNMKAFAVCSHILKLNLPRLNRKWDRVLEYRPTSTLTAVSERMIEHLKSHNLWVPERLVS